MEREPACEIVLAAASSPRGLRNEGAGRLGNASTLICVALRKRPARRLRTRFVHSCCPRFLAKTRRFSRATSGRGLAPPGDPSGLAVPEASGASVAAPPALPMNAPVATRTLSRRAARRIISRNFRAGISGKRVHRPGPARSAGVHPAIPFRDNPSPAPFRKRKGPRINLLPLWEKVPFGFARTADERFPTHPQSFVIPEAPLSGGAVRDPCKPERGEDARNHRRFTCSVRRSWVPVLPLPRQTGMTNGEGGPERSRASKQCTPLNPVIQPRRLAGRQTFSHKGRRLKGAYRTTAMASEAG